jgi:hypothetical protein
VVTPYFFRLTAYGLNKGFKKGACYEREKQGNKGNEEDGTEKSEREEKAETGEEERLVGQNGMCPSRPAGRGRECGRWKVEGGRTKVKRKNKGSNFALFHFICFI